MHNISYIPVIQFGSKYREKRNKARKDMITVIII